MTLLPQRLDGKRALRYATISATIATKRKLFQLAARLSTSMTSIWSIAARWLMRWEADERVDGLGDAQQWQAPLWKRWSEYTCCAGAARSGIAPICTNVLSARWKRRMNRQPGCLREFLFAGFRRCRQFICRRCRRWSKHVDIICPVHQPCRYYWGDIKDPAFLWRNCCPPAPSSS